MKVKVCGITTVEQMQALSQMNIDYVGMIFYRGSKRYAAEKLQNYKATIKDLTIKKLGVFVEEEELKIKQAIDDYGLYAVQLHGNESPEFCKSLNCSTTIIKAFKIEDQTNVEKMIKPYHDSCDYFLFDTQTVNYGGSGKKFNWSILEKEKISKPFFLSGGIELEDVQKLKSFHHPFLYAIDINSRFELSAGIKDLNTVKKFSDQIKQLV